LKVMVGYFSTLKKLGDLRSASRIALAVEMEVVEIVTSIRDLEGFFSSQSTVPVIPPKEPRTLLTGTRRI
jgi:hypothetical protein